MSIITEYPNAFAIAGIVLLAVENILPHLPIKANSTVQVVINVVMMILGRGKK